MLHRANSTQMIRIRGAQVDSKVRLSARYGGASFATYYCNCYNTHPGRCDLLHSGQDAKCLRPRYLESRHVNWHQQAYTASIAFFDGHIYTRSDPRHSVLGDNPISRLLHCPWRASRQTGVVLLNMFPLETHHYQSTNSGDQAAHQIFTPVNLSTLESINQ